MRNIGDALRPHPVRMALGLLGLSVVAASASFGPAAADAPLPSCHDALASSLRAQYGQAVDPGISVNGVAGSNRPDPAADIQCRVGDHNVVLGGPDHHIVDDTAGDPRVGQPADPARPTCHGRPATITGTGYIQGPPGDNVIVGTGPVNWINGGEGNDIICGGSSFNVLIGGPGNNIVDGGAGANVIIGNNFSIAGNVDGRCGDNILQGGTGLMNIIAGNNAAEFGHAECAGGHGGSNFLSGGQDSFNILHGGSAAFVGSAAGSGGDNVLVDPGNNGDIFVGHNGSIFGHAEGDSGDNIEIDSGGTAFSMAGGNTSFYGASGRGGNNILVGPPGGTGFMAGDNQSAIGPTISGDGGNNLMVLGDGPNGIGAPVQGHNIIAALDVTIDGIATSLLGLPQIDRMPIPLSTFTGNFPGFFGYKQGGGDDRIVGGLGNDTIDTGPGDNYVDGGPGGVDRCAVGPGNNTVRNCDIVVNHQ
ncbi:hypothetical protein IRT45_12925 [Nocardia sp. BSTN01]|uniref:hypothetical protein n=1 Tax=Nocardia sp. BSTN01 TaxID=2783665 RepID=UPI00188F1CFF|nr:hypothetical protein [Nocardia sp. BSTN01]MBF4998054.1 hypothetical protein [Nocardia sp. BSTN01]